MRQVFSYVQKRSSPMISLIMMQFLAGIDEGSAGTTIYVDTFQGLDQAE